MQILIKKENKASKVITEGGFSLIELLIVMVLFTFVMAVSSSVFVNILGESKTQARLAETQIEGIIGLETIGSDIGHAGHGLPWKICGVTYSEAPTGTTAANYNVSQTVNQNPPPALMGDSAGPNIAGSSYLVIRATNIAANTQSQNLAVVINVAGTPTMATPSGTGSDAPAVGQWVIAVDPRDPTDADATCPSTPNFRKLVTNTAATSQFSVQIANATTFPSNYAPTDDAPTYLVYGISDTQPRMPFNRADYFITTANVPTTCAPGTGVLTKNLVNHADGSFSAMPLVDCVADFQVIYGLDTTGTGTISTYTNTLMGLTSAQVRQVQQVRVYILVHEGRRDTAFRFNNFTGAGGPPKILVGETGVGGNSKDISGIQNYLNYRWKVLRLVVATKNLVDRQRN